jgi:hypothetical protein
MHDMVFESPARSFCSHLRFEAIAPRCAVLVADAVVDYDVALVADDGVALGRQIDALIEGAAED